MIHTPRRLASLLPTVAAMVLAVSAGAVFAIDFPGPARAAIQRDTITLENNVLRFTWTTRLIPGFRGHTTKCAN